MFFFVFSSPGNSWADRVKGIVPSSPLSPKSDTPNTPDQPTLPSPPPPLQNGLSSEADTDGSNTIEGKL